MFQRSKTAGPSVGIREHDVRSILLTLQSVGKGKGKKSSSKNKYSKWLKQNHDSAARVRQALSCFNRERQAARRAPGMEEKLNLRLKIFFHIFCLFVKNSSLLGTRLWAREKRDRQEEGRERMSGHRNPKAEIS